MSDWKSAAQQARDELDAADAERAYEACTFHLARAQVFATLAIAEAAERVSDDYTPAYAAASSGAGR